MKVTPFPSQTCKSNEDDKAKFNEYGIKYDLLRSNNTLFNYPSFIKYLNYEGTYRSVKEWIDILVDDDDLNEVGELISIVMILWN
ncbi:hypothetical protein GLOIN_2v1774275 [Rhizophagus irregularis DAOM 181602=DAOM 197198]|nr:hypothetical protein GLOIN_2v1774275 [Rhizophagus irregularis DAOM 181602=DAOM 197198]